MILWNAVQMLSFQKCSSLGMHAPKQCRNVCFVMGHRADTLLRDGAATHFLSNQLDTSNLQMAQPLKP